MLANPEFLSVACGLVFAGLLYAYARYYRGGAAGQQPPGQPPSGVSSKELVMAFVTVAVLVYGAFYIAMRSGAYQAVGPNIVMQTGAAAPF
jgi:hypothetical protein